MSMKKKVFKILYDILIMAMYIAMVFLIMIFFTGNGVFIYEGL